MSENILTNNNIISNELEHVLAEICPEFRNENDLLIPLYKPTKFSKKILVISGGGIKGIYFIGALHSLYEMHILNDFEIYAGTSVGAILLFLINIGYTPIELFNIIKNMDLTKLKKINMVDIFDTFGLDNGNKFLRLLKKLTVKKKISCDITFNDLFEMTKKKLIVTVTNINKRCAEYMSYETHPNLPILQALRMSLSVPLLFSPVLFNNNYYVDGGCTDNFPIGLFSHRKDELLGICASIKKQNNVEIKTIDEYIYQLISSIYFGSANEPTKNFDKNIIKIFYGDENPIKFDLSHEEKDAMFELGYSASHEYFEGN